ncbi:F-box domain containing protein [Parasponia andersonii]|uniref:F-box domain containing protein n=1 Tax=Parasponia andersonii TaxID=3476 RepID=A0A2P5D2B6_PARAD|nr:F-box domain containing protein [Parasponia andersonii]
MSIITAKWVCKTWHDLASDPKFSKLLLLEDNDTHLLIRDVFLFSLVKPKLCSGLCFCERCRDRKVNLSFYTTQIMLSNKVEDHHRHDHPNKNFNKYKFVNSCNGLLCLSGPMPHRNIVVCNPITGEFMYLPMPSVANVYDFRISGFGFSPMDTQYKVIRTLVQATFDPDVWLHHWS